MAWHRQFAAYVNEAIARLARSEAEQFETELHEVFAQFAGLLDLVVIGESTMDDAGVLWFDANETDAAAVAADGDLLRRCPAGDGPFSVLGRPGTTLLAAPAQSGGFSRFTAASLRPHVAASGDVVIGLEVVSSVVGAARQRVIAEHNLRQQVETQRFLGEFAHRAAVAAADDATLLELLQSARDRFGVSSASTLVRDGDEYLLVATTDFLGTTVLEPGSRIKADLKQLDDLMSAGHSIRSLGSFDNRPSSLRAEGEVLSVPSVGPEGVEGLVVFADVNRRSWTAAEIGAAKSVAGSLQKLTLRAEREREHRQRRALDGLVTDAASLASSATLETLDGIVDEALRLAIERLDIRGAALWAVGPEHSVRVMGRWNDGRTTRRPATIALSEAERAALVENGHAVVRIATLDTDSLDPDDGLALVVPIGAEPAGLVVLVDPDRHWSGEDIAAAKALANIAEQTRARLSTETMIRSRLREERFAAAIASRSVDIDLANIEDRVKEMLRLALDHYGVVEASMWRIKDGRMSCWNGVRRDGHDPTRGAPVSVPDLNRLRHEGLVVARLGDLHDGDATRPEADDAPVLIVGLDDTDRIPGALVLIDPMARRWQDESIASVRAFTDTLNQLRLRTDVTRRLARQEAVDAVLATASRDFVDTTLDDAPEAIAGVLESMRVHLRLASLCLVELDPAGVSMRCVVEAADDGMDLFGGCFPASRDSRAIARMLDPGGPETWSFADLFDGTGRGAPSVVVVPSVQGRDLTVLLAATAPGRPLDTDIRSILAALMALLAQLRHRLLLESKSRRRSAADQLVAEIARAFVEQPPYNHERAVEHGLRLIGEFFDLRAVGWWAVNGDGPATVEGWWGSPDHEHEMLTDPGALEKAGSLRDVLAALGEAGTIDLPDHTPGGRGLPDTVALQRVDSDGPHAGVLVAWTPRARHLIPDVDVLGDVLARVARLMEQLLRRAEADRAVVRQLRFEDLLRRFATRMVDADADETDRIDETLGRLMAEVEVDHASIWLWQPDDEGFLVDAVHVVTLGDARPLGDEFVHFRMPAGFTLHEHAPHFSRDVSIWDLDDAPAGMQRLLRESVAVGPRQVAFLRSPGTDPEGGMRFLLISRPGSVPFGSDEIEFFRSAHSILVQHEARVAAERWFSVAFDSSPIGITLRAADHSLIHCNAAYSELVGRSVAQLRGTGFGEVMAADTAAVMNALFEDGFEETRQIETSYRRPDGTVRWASVRCSPVRLPGRRGPLMLTYAEDITERRRNRETLEYQATHDELTGLPNRRSLVGEIATELGRPGDCAVLVLDLDRFKVVNDSLGHSAGDQLLIACADRIRLSLRPGDSVCRLGGDEFAVLLRSPADHHVAAVVAERLLALLAEPVTVEGDELFPSASIGVALPEPGDSTEDLLRHADTAMYQVKARGRNGWEVFDGSMRQAVVERVRTEADLRRAIENGQLEVHYQPEFLLDSGTIVGTEALVRWRHPERGLLAAGSFISLAEETGLVVELGAWVLAQATQQGARWLHDGYGVITRVNLSARQLRGAIVSEVEEALATAGLPADRLCLELTETAIMDDVQESARILGQFRDLGVQVAIDDFGTGFSSLAYLKRFPVDILKIDRTFVDGVGVDPDDTAIVRSVIGLAQTLRLDVVAEGIEDATQLDELVRLGCSRGQGFYLARPAPAEEVSQLLTENLSTRSPGPQE